MGSIAMSVASAKETVPPKNKDIAALIPSDLSGSLKRLLMGIEVARNPYCAGLSDCPLLATRNNILTVSYHWWDSSKIR